MKTTCLAGLLLLAAGCNPAPRYEFHTGLQGAMIWRCDKQTGTVEWATVKDQRWQTIANELPTLNLKP